MRLRTLPVLAAIASAAFAQSGPVTLHSPNGHLAITFSTVTQQTPSSGNQLSYSVTYKDKPLIDSSALTLDLEGMRPLGSDVRIVGQKTSSIDQTYQLVTGKASNVRDHYNFLRLDVEEAGSPNRKLTMEARAYDDAVAFRYVVPEQPALRIFRLAKEHTEFRVSKDATVTRWFSRTSAPCTRASFSSCPSARSRIQAAFPALF